MAKKNNIRSIRFSDEMIEMIESQAGETFTAKFEALVTRCMWELPRKEQELKGIQERIDYERKNLKYIQDMKQRTRHHITMLNSVTESAILHMQRCVEGLEEIKL